MWLRGDPTLFVRTPAFVAIVSELLSLLEDPYTPRDQAYTAVRRAARVLTALVEEAERKPRPGAHQPRW